MDAQRFEEWFSQIVLKLEPGSVVIMDNAPYHSRRLEALPTTAWRKAKIIDWLSQKNIPHDPQMLKVQLLNIARQHKSRYIKYAVDEMARENNITVHRLPPYHCELNPIELIWAQVKNNVAKKNSTFKMSEVKKLLLEALQDVTSENWKKCVSHVIKEEDKMWDLDTTMDVVVDLQPLVIRLDEDVSSSSESESESESE